jgi:hypothetical protein
MAWDRERCQATCIMTPAARELLPFLIGRRSVRFRRQSLGEWARSSDFWARSTRLWLEGDSIVNKRRRLEDRYHVLVLQRRLWNVMRVALVLFPAMLALGIGYALGPYLGPLF